MTAYRRYPRRDDLVEALVRRETQRFLAAVADAIDAVEDPHEGVAEAFIAAVTFAREHPMLRRAGQLEPAPIADSAELLAMGSAFIANYIHGEGRAHRRNRCVGWPTCSPGCSSPTSRCRPRIPTSVTTPNCGGSRMRC